MSIVHWSAMGRAPRAWVALGAIALCLGLSATGAGPTVGLAVVQGVAARAR